MKWIFNVAILLMISCSANASLIAYDLKYSGPDLGVGVGLLVADTERNAIVGFRMLSVSGHKFDFFWVGFSELTSDGYFMGDALLHSSVKGISNYGEAWSVDHQFWLHLPSNEKSLAEQFDLHEHWEDKSWLRNQTETFISDFMFFNKREISRLPDIKIIAVGEPSSILLLSIFFFIFLIRLSAKCDKPIFSGV